MISRVAVLLGLAAVLSFAQPTAPASVDVGEEPKHHLAFQNDFVLAFEVTVSAGTETLIHLIKMRAGEVQWFAGGVSQEWRNNAATPARYVVLQFFSVAQ